MQSPFWNNTIWYLLLGITTVIELIFILIKASNRKVTFALFCTIAGITFVFEAIILCFLKAYNYYPMIIPQSPLDDALAGNLFSQFSVTTTSMLIAVLNLKYYWIFIFAVMYGLIEEFFLYLGIYRHYWYQTWMTVVCLILLFGIVKRLYKTTFKPIGNRLRYIYISLGLYTLHMPTIAFTFKILGILSFNMEILPDAMHSYALLSLLNLLLISIICMIVYFSTFKMRWKLILISLLFFTLYFACKINLIHIKEGWFLIFTSIDIFSMFFFIYILDKFYNVSDKR